MCRYEELVDLSESLANLVTQNDYEEDNVLHQLDALSSREATAVVAMMTEAAVGDASFEQSPSNRVLAVDVRWKRFKMRLLDRCLLPPEVDSAISEFADAQFDYGDDSDDGSHERCVLAEKNLREAIVSAFKVKSR